MPLTLEELLKRAREWNKLCDMCSGELPLVKHYRAITPISGPMEVEGKRIIMEDNGDWFACAVCADLIERDEWKKLAERALVPLRSLVPDMSEEFHLDAVRVMWTLVFGERVNL